MPDLQSAGGQTAASIDKTRSSIIAVQKLVVDSYLRMQQRNQVTFIDFAVKHKIALHFLGLYVYFKWWDSRTI